MLLLVIVLEMDLIFDYTLAAEALRHCTQSRQTQLIKVSSCYLLIALVRSASRPAISSAR